MRIIISLTSIPPRFQGLPAILESLLRQSVTPTKIEINIPKKYRNPKFTMYSASQIPEGFEVRIVEEDYGPATKILPTVQRYRDQDVVIIYVDDDRIYRPDLIESLVTMAEQHPTCAIAAYTVSVKRQLRESYWRKRPLNYRLCRLATFGTWNPKRAADHDEFRIAEGFGGVLVRPHFFDNQLFNFPDHLRSVDDVWISGMLSIHGHSIIEASSIKPSSQPNKVHGKDIGLLHALVQSTHENRDRFEVNEMCIRHLQEHFGIWKNI
jgi:hypothetical protein